MIAWYSHHGGWGWGSWPGVHHGGWGWWAGVHHGGWGWGWWPGLVWTVLLGAALLAGAIYLAWRRPAPAATGPVPPATAPVPPAAESAEAALAQRYARGDIDADEYRDRLAVLREHPDGGPIP